MHSGDVNNDITSMDDLTTEINSWDMDELNAKFLDILEDMNIPADKRDPLLSKDAREKREMLLMHYKGEEFGFVVCYLRVFYDLLPLPPLPSLVACFLFRFALM